MSVFKEKKTYQASNRKKIKRSQKMHATKKLKTRNPRGCNHSKGRYINMSLIIGSYIIDFELE
jgi:hypothetical protein